MKLCDISILYYPHGGGIKTYIENKRIVYKRRNIDHILIAPNVKNLDKVEKVVDGSSTIYYVPSKRVTFAGTEYFFFKNFDDITKILKEEQPNVIEIGDKMTAFIFKKKIKALHNYFKVRICAFSHERADNFSKTVLGNKLLGGILAKMVVKRFVTSADYIISNSDFTAQELTKLIPKEKIHIVHLGIDAKGLDRQKYYSQELYDKLSDNGTKSLLIHVGRLDKDKKISLLVQFAKKLDPAKYKLIVVGGGGAEKAISALPVVEFTGYVDYEIVKQHLAVAQVGVLVNDIEPYGLVGLEMMAMELVVLGPNKGGLISFLKPAFAWLLPYDADKYIEALNEWQSLSETDKKAKAKLARQEINNYTLDIMLDQLIEIYHHA